MRYEIVDQGDVDVEMKKMKGSIHDIATSASQLSSGVSLVSVSTIIFAAVTVYVGYQFYLANVNQNINIQVLNFLMWKNFAISVISPT